jgi:hypothetical protein
LHFIFLHIIDDRLRFSVGIPIPSFFPPFFFGICKRRGQLDREFVGGIGEEAQKVDIWLYKGIWLHPTQSLLVSEKIGTFFGGYGMDVDSEFCIHAHWKIPSVQS